MFISVTTQFTTRESPCGELSSYNVMLFFLKKNLNDEATIRQKILSLKLIISCYYLSVCARNKQYISNIG